MTRLAGSTSLAVLLACTPPSDGGTGTSTTSGSASGATATSSGSASGVTSTGGDSTTSGTTGGGSTSATTSDGTTSGTTTGASEGSTTGEGTTGVVDPEDCATNPIPWCDADTRPTPNGVPSSPPGLGGCPPGMARVDTFCVDRWEAALVEVLPGDVLGPWSPYASPAGAQVRALSAPGLVPQGYISQVEASAACVAAGKRLCSDSEWLRACRGAAMQVFPYGDDLVPGACNDARTCHPAIQYFETAADWIWSELGHPCLNQLPAGLDPTGANPACVSDDGIYDMMGNLHEWTADPEGTFRGGFYVDTKINGPGCLYVTTAHNVYHWDYSTGFRCCAD
ncbi:MAG: SUMF1/EgtB/PvdO family nonheme iron enzyme [Myxococcales bacterium]|nr:SUMF1/EgtB/PvdO family nonheme iron enzyme [Myxococcales bacterium]